MVDVDSASADELARLPRVGLGLAKTITAYRQEHGPFGSLERLDRVPGIGPGLLKTIAAHVMFSGAGALRAVGQMGGGAPAPLNINSATLTELDALPGVGPTKAAAILQYRQEHGPFAAVDQLARVPGLGAGAVARLRDHVSAP
jgi:competence protein ComEA